MEQEQDKTIIGVLHKRFVQKHAKSVARQVDVDCTANNL